MVENLWRDVSSAIRSLRSRSGSTAVVVLSLAIGIGPTTVAFSLFNAMALRGLPGVGGQDRLVTLGLSVPGPGGHVSSPSVLSLSDVEVLGGQRAVFAGVAGAGRAEVAVDAGNGPFVTLAEVVTANYFRLLSAPAQRGRVFTGEVDDEDRAGEVVASHRFWQERLGGDPGAPGRTLRINGETVQLVGIMPPGFTGMTAGDVVDRERSAPGLWMPVAAAGLVRPAPVRRSGPDDPSARWLRGVARLAPGVTKAELGAALPALSRRLEAAHPAARRGARLVAGDLIFGPGAGEHRALLTLVAFLAVPLIVLLVACANAAGLLLARTAARRGELSLRAALGATRGALLRQLLVESVIMGLLAGVLAVAVAAWSRELAELFAVHLSMEAPLDWTVLAFSLGASLVAGLGFGLLPALSSSRKDPGVGLSGSGRGSGPSRRTARVRNGLVVAQVTLSLVLLVTGGLFLRSVRNGLTVDTGMDEDHLLTLTLDLDVLGYSEAEGRAFYRRLTEQVRSLPGVRAAALADRPPLAGLGSVRVSAGAGPADGGFLSSVARVGAGWFEATGVRLLAGSGFPEGSGEAEGEGPRSVVVSRALATTLWPEASPLGRTLRIGEGGGEGTPLEVRGVAEDMRTHLHQPPEPVLFLPLTAYGSRASLLVRTEGPAADMAPAVRGVIGRLDPALPVHAVETALQMRQRELLPWRLMVRGMGFLGALALFLAAAGLYAVTAFTVTRRTREIGVRLALGADRVRVAGMVLRWSLGLVGSGVLLGTVLSGVVASLMRRMFVGVSPLDPLTYGALGALLGLTAVAAALWPAVRAASVQPSRVLAE